MERDNYLTALANATKGYVSIPCRPGTKVPLVKWKQYQTQEPTMQDYERWFLGTRNNIAIITSGLVVFDCDAPEKAELILEHCGETPHRLLTPRGGIHLGYRKRMGVVLTNKVKIKGEPIDIRTDGGIEMLPVSRTEDGEYRWDRDGLVPREDLPLARIGWTRTRTRKKVRATIALPEEGDWFARGSAYVAKIDPAVSGQGGHRQTFIAALKIVRLAQGDPARAWTLLRLYNETRCEPPWDEDSLRHKLDDALKVANRHA